ncbi:hypothetical protein ERO13_A09G081901v2 [Gossypium hirsutum]|uniref:Thioesterase domain-containing protein n=1 Tax=Gossypium mustelinum TaxID=34275 RepID=A0A5D2XVX0_GOSMU|nr:hypothetical protein ERO13_A09G081901v2 [Gossypium hirsutum]TYJ17962.1 hypothetical protein E1A91_A09G089200v1 [Gossypium mustelinum]
MEGDPLKKSLTWLHGVLRGKIGHGIETRVLQGLRIILVEKEFMQFDFVVPNVVSDVDGNWHVGALASLLDLIGTITTFWYADCVSAVVDFNSSYYSTVKIQEHVEIESRVMADKGKLMHVVVQVRKKGNGEVIAVGNLWMASNKLTIAQVSNL